MSSAWGVAWGQAWGASWGDSEEIPETPQPEPEAGGGYLLARQAPRVGRPREEDEAVVLHLIR